MHLSMIWSVMVLLSVFCAVISGRAGLLTAAFLEGASTALTTSITLAGPLALWSGLARLMEVLGLTGKLGRVLSPGITKLFPSARHDPVLRTALAGNLCANVLGLGNAATPLGLQAARRLVDPADPHRASDELCRLVVMNTASVQLLPTTVAALRSGQGSAAPFDILPCVWLSSVLSVATGLSAALVFQRWCHD